MDSPMGQRTSMVARLLTARKDTGGQNSVQLCEFWISLKRREMPFHDLPLASRRRAGKTARIRVPTPVLDRRLCERGKIPPGVFDPDQLLGDIQQRRDVVRSEHGR